MSIYQEIYDFCSVRNEGNCFLNGDSPTPRFEFLLNLVERAGIDHEVVEFALTSAFHDGENKGYNLILPGSSNRWVTAHHDIVNPNSDNANDNSASCINAIALKLLCPEINIAILDGEEFGGKGSHQLSQEIIDGKRGEVEWILNFELTGRGGKSFFIEKLRDESVLGELIKDLHACPEVMVPFNDAVIFRRYGIDSLTINPVPQNEEGGLDTKVLWLCHSIEDSVDKLSTDEMQEFVEEIVKPIICS